MFQIEKFVASEIRHNLDYKYFLPNLINKNCAWSNPKLNKLIESASYYLAQLNSFAKLVPNLELFIHLHVTKEAVVSSRI